MKFLMLGLVSLFASSVFAATPFIPEVEARFKAIETVGSTTAYKADGILQSRIARATYDVAVDGGGIGAHLLGVSLPANALVRQVWFQMVTQFSDSGSGTVALSCEDAGNLYNAADVTGISAGATTSGVATGTAANMIDGIAAACELTATVAGAAQLTGKMIVFVEYYIIE